MFCGELHLCYAMGITTHKALPIGEDNRLTIAIAVKNIYLLLKYNLYNRVLSKSIEQTIEYIHVLKSLYSIYTQ